MNRHARRTTLILTLSAAALLPACNTVSGLGEDLRSASEATRDALSGSDDQPRTASTNDGSMPEKK